MYDVVFIGAGPGGYEGAVYAAKKGLKTAVIEKNKPGGTCLQWGCIPTKQLLHCTKIIKYIKTADKFGINAQFSGIHLETIAKNKQRLISKLTKGIELLFKQNNIELFFGNGFIKDAQTIEISGSQEIQTKNIVIATGSEAAELPQIKVDGKCIINSTHALELNSIPKKMLVIGAGAVGVELGLIYQYLGAEVTIVEIMDHIIPGNDTELTTMLQNELKKQQLKIYTQTRFQIENYENDKITGRFSNQTQEWSDTFDKVLLSVGRKPNTENLFAASLGIKLDKRGYICVNSNLQTDAASIFACGDVAGPPLLAHKASHEAIAIVDYLLTNQPVHLPPIPGAVFTNPELAGVGLTEDSAKEQKINYKIGRFPYSAGSRSNAIDEKTGLVKVICDQNNHLLGAHILGAEASELMPLLVYGVSKKMKAEDFREMIFIHPTLSENIFEALGNAGGFAIHG
jgi:dihydrolipoamide dehydrogenase